MVFQSCRRHLVLVTAIWALQTFVKVNSSIVTVVVVDRQMQCVDSCMCDIVYTRMVYDPLNKVLLFQMDYQEGDIVRCVVLHTVHSKVCLVFQVACWPSNRVAFEKKLTKKN